MLALFRRAVPALIVGVAIAPDVSALALVQSPDARPFSYSFAEVSVFRTDIDDFDEESDGFGLQGAYGFAENFYVFAGASRESVDVSGFGDLDVDTVQVGAGFHTPIGDRTDFVGELAYVHAEAELAGVDDSEDGWAASVGVRHWLAERFEVDGSITHVDLDDSDTGFGFGGQFYATEKLSIGASYTVFDDTDTIALGVRFNF